VKKGTLAVGGGSGGGGQDFWEMIGCRVVTVRGGVKRMGRRSAGALNGCRKGPAIGICLRKGGKKKPRKLTSGAGGDCPWYGGRSVDGGSFFWGKSKKNNNVVKRKKRKKRPPSQGGTETSKKPKRHPRDTHFQKGDKGIAAEDVQDRQTPAANTQSEKDTQRRKKLRRNPRKSRKTKKNRPAKSIQKKSPTPTGCWRNRHP